MDVRTVPPPQRLTRRALGRAATGAAAAGGALALAACGVAGGGSGSPAGSGASQPVQGRIEFWALNSAMLETFVKEFNERNPNARAEFVPRGNWVELFEKLYAAIAADTGPDLVRVKEYNTIDLGAIKALQPLDPFIKADKAFKADQFTPEQWKTANFDGAQYGVPFFNSIHVLLWNKPLFQQAGLNPDRAPQTWPEFREAARRTAKPDQNQWGFKLFDYGTREAVLVWWLRFAWTNGGRLFDNDATRVVVNSEPCVEALQLFTDMLYKDRSAAPPEAHAQAVPWNGNVGLWETGAYGMVDMDKRAPSIPYGVAELPWAKHKLALVYQDNLIIAKTGKNKEGGWAPLKYATEPEQDYRWALDGGALPSRKENFRRAPFDGSDPRWKVFVDAFNNPTSKSKPVVIKWEEFALTITEELDAAFKNLKSPKQALDDAARRATQFVQENGSTRLTRHLLKDK
jgi:ABC-type glycerol-3-phosphate transport system substrate-binding protein